CSPTGGLWGSSNQGQSWTNLNTDHLPLIGASDVVVVVDPNTNQRVKFLALGGGKDDFSYSAGVYRAGDDNAWQRISSGLFLGNFPVIRRLVGKPGCASSLLAATSDGIFYCDDALCPSPTCPGTPSCSG